MIGFGQVSYNYAVEDEYNDNDDKSTGQPVYLGNYTVRLYQPVLTLRYSSKLLLTVNVALLKLFLLLVVLDILP